MSTNERMMGDSKPSGGARQPSLEIPIGNLAHGLAQLLAGSIAQSVGTLQREARPTNSNPASLASIVVANLAAGQRRLPPTFEDAPTARTPVPRAPAASDDHDLVVDESMLIAPTWRVPENREKGWFSQPLRSALFGVAISVIIGMAALFWLTGFF
jgi:hypothetical protein